MNDRTKSILLVTLLMMSTLSVAFTGTVAAQDSRTAECQEAFDTLESPCYISAGIYNAIFGAERVPDDPNLGTQSENYYGAQSLDERQTARYTNHNNSLPATRAYAYSLAESAFSRSMAQGDGQATAEMKADKAVANYILGEIRNKVVRPHNAAMTNAVQMDADEDTNVKVNTDSGGSGYHINGTQTTNKTVLSGSAIDGANLSYVEVKRDGYQEFFDAADVGSYGDIAEFSVSFTSSDYDTQTINVPEYDQLETRYLNIYSEVQNEISVFTDNINASEYDNLNASDISSPITEAVHFGQRYNETGSSGYAAALAASAGLHTSTDVGTSYKVELLETSQNYTGVLYGAGFPNNSINVDTVYDGANMTAYVNPVSQTEPVNINQDFEVHRIELLSGETVNSTSTRQYTYKSLNSTQPLRTLESYQELLNQTGDLEDDGGIGGGGLGDLLDGSGPLGVSWIVWLLGGVVVVVAVSSRD